VEIFENKKILITGGTGTFGKAFTEFILKTKIKKVYIYSRDEYKQYKMKSEFNNDSRIAFLIGDIKDKDRLYRAFNQIDFVVHAAAQKHVPSCEYNPFEAVNTNIIGAQNIIDAAIDRKVKKVVALSTDKAVNPVNLYGMTKGCMEKLFIAGNAYAGGTNTILACVRYGNVMGSRGSVIPLFKKCAAKNIKMPITDINMTRFWLKIEQAVDFVACAFELMQGGEIFIPKLPSMKIIDLAESISIRKNYDIVGIRQGEKLHETLVNCDEAANTLEMPYYFIIFPDYYWFENKLPNKEKNGKRLERGFVYSSDKNDKWLTVKEMREILCLK
jgi:UDP-N-acetylglucosamine 4,6-dehydratase